MVAKLRTLFNFKTNYKKALLLLLAIWVGIIGSTATWYAYTATTIWEDDGLRTRATTIASLLPSSMLEEAWVGSTDATHARYLDLKDRFYSVKKANPDLVVYLMVRRQGVIQFVADSEIPGTEIYSPPGQEYTEAPQDLHDLWRYNRPYVHAHYTDRWGTWTSGFASIFDDKGRVVGVVGVDQNGTTRTILGYVTVGSVVLVTVLLLFFIISLYRVAINDEQTAALKSDFLGMASHELRSPLSAVRWKMAALARDDKTPQTVRDALMDMERHLAHVVSLSSTFLQFTSLDHNLLVESMRKEVSLNQALWSAVAKVSIQAEQKKMTLWYANATSVLEGVTIFGVEEYVSLAIINVLGNAIKYSPEGTQIDVEAWVKDGTVGVAIMDRGPGIAAKDMAKMYTAFFRTKDAQLSGKPGSGFGMYATNKVMKFHGGTITHTNRDGGGTVCTLTFPIYTKTTGA